MPERRRSLVLRELTTPRVLLTGTRALPREIKFLKRQLTREQTMFTLRRIRRCSRNHVNVERHFGEREADLGSLDGNWVEFSEDSWVQGWV